MANILVYSFENTDVELFGLEWSLESLNDPFTIEQDSVRSAGCLHYGPGNYASIGIAQHATYHIGFRFSFDDTPLSDRPIMNLYDGTTLQLSLFITTAKQLLIKRNGTTIWTGTTVLSPNTFYYIEWSSTIDNTTGSTACYLNGSSSPDATAFSGDTQQSSNAYATIFSLGQSGGARHVVYKVHDLYINTGSGSSPDNTRWGDTKVTNILPNAAGTTNNLTSITTGTAASTNVNEVDDNTPTAQSQTVLVTASSGNLKLNFNHIGGATSSTANIAYNSNAATVQSALESILGAGCCSVSGTDLTSTLTITWAGDYLGNQNLLTYTDVSLSVGATVDIAISAAGVGRYDGDSTYVYGTSGYDTYNFPSLGFSASTIRAACVRIAHRKGDATGRTVDAKIRSGGTDYDAGSPVSSSLTYAVTPFLLAQDPATAAAWTQSNLEAAEFGVKVA